MITVAGCADDGGGKQAAGSDGGTASSEPRATDPDLKVAFIGDSANGDSFRDVLQLIEDEGTDLVVHAGDFDYDHDADGFFATIDDVLGPDYPYLAIVGNHDAGSWGTGCGDPDGCYATFVRERMARLGIEPDDRDLNDQMYSTTYRGLRLVFVGENSANTGDCADSPSGYACYIRNQLANDDHIWNVCAWHKNQRAMQVGGKPDEMSWAVYRNCIDAGAIVVTAHEHSYQRTKTLTNAQRQEVDLEQHPPVAGVPGKPNSLRVGPGRSFVAVSGLGGHSMRDQERCLPDSYPYGCNSEWASIYTTNQTRGEEKFGALFLEFNVDGDRRKARGYFKTTDGDVIDSFEVVADAREAFEQP